MKGALFFLIAASMSFATRGLAQDFNPHRMVDEEGALDMSVCGLCHTDELELSSPKEDVCVTCHAVTTHAGSAEHLQATSAEVARLAPKSEQANALPLTDAGGMYCGTCHLFHDPAVAGEKGLAAGWVPSSSGYTRAVRESLTQQFESTALQRGKASAEVSFATEGTRALRLPVADGSLCKRCHGNLVK